MYRHIGTKDKIQFLFVWKTDKLVLFYPFFTDVLLFWKYVLLLISECKSNTYGANCNMTCGNCLKKEQCNHISGNCRNGCDRGFQKPKCNTGI